MLGLGLSIPELAVRGRARLQNLLTWSEAFDNAAWAKSVTTVTANTTAAPDGTTTADTLEDTSTTAYGNVNQSSSAYASELTASAHIKKDAVGRATRFGMLRITFSGGTTKVHDLKFDTSTGETTGAGGSVEELADYWRFIVSATDTGGNTSASVTLYPAAGASATWALDAATTGSVIAWGAQLNDGLTALTYKKTEGSAFP